MLRAVLLTSLVWFLASCLAFPGPQQPTSGLPGQDEYNQQLSARQGANTGIREASEISSRQTAVEADRAEISGVLARFTLSSQRQTYLFLVHEYKGRKVIRQSACRIASLQRGGGKQLRTHCFEVSEKGGETMKDYLWNIQFHYFESKNRPKEETLKRTFSVSFILEHFRQFDMHLIFNRQKSGKKLINEFSWDCEPKDDYFTAVNCLWEPLSDAERTIEPYSWMPSS